MKGRESPNLLDHVALRRKLEAANDYAAELQRRLAAVEAAHARCDARIRELQEQNTSLVQLAVAAQLLTGVHDRAAVLTAIEEIVVNMVGSEELAIFEVGNDGETLRLVFARGIDEDSPTFLQSAEPVRRALSSGSVVVLGDRSFTAAVPLVIDANAVGVVAIFTLLPQKSTLEPVDHDLFALLKDQGALALYSSALRSMRTTLRRHAGQPATTREPR